MERTARFRRWRLRPEHDQARRAEAEGAERGGIGVQAVRRPQVAGERVPVSVSAAEHEEAGIRPEPVGEAGGPVGAGAQRGGQLLDGNGEALGVAEQIDGAVEGGVHG